jgi:cyclohexyl-isocyanide hydratase
MFDGFRKRLSRRTFAQNLAASLTVASQSSLAMSATGAPSQTNSSQDEPKAGKSSHLTIGCLVYPRQDQVDFTGPFEVLSRIPDSTVHVIGKERLAFRDVKGLILTPDMTIKEAPQLDLLLVSGGLGQQALIDDEEVLALIKNQADSGRYVFSICTGALLCGAAGMLRGRRATTHWAAHHLLRYYGAIPVKSRVVIDGNYISTAGVTAGLDGSFKVASILRGDAVAEEIQLDIEYAPEPPFNSGTPETASAEVIRVFFENYGAVRESRDAEARRFAIKLGVVVKS